MICLSLGLADPLEQLGLRVLRMSGEDGLYGLKHLTDRLLKLLLSWIAPRQSLVNPLERAQALHGS